MILILLQAELKSTKPKAPAWKRHLKLAAGSVGLIPLALFAAVAIGPALMGAIAAGLLGTACLVSSLDE
jgi:hypothetical protein